MNYEWVCSERKQCHSFSEERGQCSADLALTQVMVDLLAMMVRP